MRAYMCACVSGGLGREVCVLGGEQVWREGGWRVAAGQGQGAGRKEE